MQINLTFDSSVNAAPAGFKTEVKQVARFLDRNYSDPITINIKVKYANIGGLGQSSFSLDGVTYNQIKTAMAGDAVSADDVAAVASLPLTDPKSGTHHYYIATALAKALGIAPGNGTALDGTVTFTNQVSFDYDRSDGIDLNKYDFYGVVAHEFTEVMGRELLCGQQIANGYTSLDLFHFRAADARTFSGTHKGYFSIDNGATPLLYFNSTGNGDFGDWAKSAHRDSFLAFSFNGVVNHISETDMREMDILGYDRVVSGAGIATPAHDTNPALLAIDHSGAVGFHAGGDWTTMAHHAPGMLAPEFA